LKDFIQFIYFRLPPFATSFININTRQSQKVKKADVIYSATRRYESFSPIRTHHDDFPQAKKVPFV
jgi:hypothetical protein